MKIVVRISDVPRLLLLATSLAYLTCNYGFGHARLATSVPCVLPGLSCKLLTHAPGASDRYFTHLPGDPFLRNYVAAMTEQAAAIKNVHSPEWTQSVVPLSKPHFATQMCSLRMQLLVSSPVPFKRRRIFVTAPLAHAYDHERIGADYEGERGVVAER